MTRPVAVIAALVVTASLSLLVLYEHYGRSDRERAVVAVRTHRFAGTTRSRVGTWLKANRPAAKLDWSASNVGPMTDDVDVTLVVKEEGQPDARYRFRVAVASRDVTSRDADTTKFIATIKSWSRE